MSLKILLLENVHDTAAKELAAEGFEVTFRVLITLYEMTAIHMYIKIANNECCIVVVGDPKGET